jgi:hypothetical protein
MHESDAIIGKGARNCGGTLTALRAESSDQSLLYPI